MNDIRRIDPSSPGFPKRFIATYVTDSYYDVSAVSGGDGFSFCIAQKPFPNPVEKRFDFELAPEYWEKCEDYGFFINDRLSGILEVYHESWNNRLRLTELWIYDGVRHRGFGGALLEFAKERGKALGCRGLVLETQSCNVPAIGCYLQHGFSFIGLDTTCYTNEDLAKKEVRLEMGLSF